MVTIIVVGLSAFVFGLAIVVLGGASRHRQVPAPGRENVIEYRERRKGMSYIYDGTGANGIPVATVINGTLYRGTGADNIPIGMIG